MGALDQDSNTIFAATYDYRTRRVAVTEGLAFASPKLFRHDSGDSFQELTAVSGQPSALSVEFVRGSGMGGGIGSILYSDRGTNREHFAYNAVGHTVALTLSSGSVTNAQYYEAYGNIVASTGQSENNRLANTKERSFTLGLDNHGMRYFDPEIGRYISADPIGYGDGLNVYIYVHNNPINHIDPLGLQGQPSSEEPQQQVQQPTDYLADLRESYAQEHPPESPPYRVLVDKNGVEEARDGGIEQLRKLDARFSEPNQYRQYLVQGEKWTPVLQAQDSPDFQMLPSVVFGGWAYYAAVMAAEFLQDPRKEEAALAVLMVVTRGKPSGRTAALDELAVMRRELGLPAALGQKGDVATRTRLEVAGQRFYGIGGHGQKMVVKVNPISAIHAEADVFNQAARARAGGPTAVLTVDNPLCVPCGTRGAVNSMARQIGVEQLEIVTPSGRVFVNLKR